MNISFERLPIELIAEILSLHDDILITSQYISKNIKILQFPITSREMTNYINNYPRQFMIIDHNGKNIQHRYYEHSHDKHYLMKYDKIYLYNSPVTIYFGCNEKFYCYHNNIDESSVPIDADFINTCGLIDIISLYNIYRRRSNNIGAIKTLIFQNLKNIISTTEFIKHYYYMINNLLLFTDDINYIEYNDMTEKNLTIAKYQFDDLYQKLSDKILKLD